MSLIQFAKSFQPAHIRAVHVAIDSEEGDRLNKDWQIREDKINREWQSIIKKTDKEWQGKVEKLRAVGNMDFKRKNCRRCELIDRHIDEIFGIKTEEGWTKESLDALRAFNKSLLENFGEKK